MKNKHSIGSVWLKKTWEEKFEEISAQKNTPMYRWQTDFISQLLKEQRKELLREIKNKGFDELTRNPDWDIPQQEILNNMKCAKCKKKVIKSYTFRNGNYYHWKCLTK